MEAGVEDPRTKLNQSPKLSAVDSSSAPRTLLTVLSTSSFGLAIFDRRFRFVGVNRALAAMNGVPEPAHPGRKIHNVVGKVALKLEPLIERVFRTGQPIRGVEISAKLPGRTAMGQWIEDYLPLSDYTGKVSNVVVLAAEVSQWGQKFGSPSHSSIRGRMGRAKLSLREVEIVRLLAKGRSNKEISSALAISVKTVEAHRTRVFLKLHLDSLVGLVHYAVRNHLVEP
jgi:DNA-binding CsgD family transcriptional regulator